MLEQTVDKLVAASERPDLQVPGHHPQLAGGQRLRAAERPALRHARPDRARQRQLRARLGAGARDGARDRAPRRDPRGPGAPGRAGEPRRHRPARAIRSSARWRSPSPRSRSRASRARRNSRPTASASASPRAPASIPTAPCASSPRWARTRICKSQRANASIRARPTSCRRIRRRPSASAMRRPTRASSAAPGAGERDRATYLAGIDGLVYGEDPSEGFVRGRRFLHPKLGFTFTAPDGFTLDNTAQAVSRRQGRRRRRRCGSTWCGCRPSRRCRTISTPAGSRTSTPRASRRSPSTACPAATATAKGDQWTFRLYAVRFGSDVYRFIFAAKHRTAAVDRTFRESVGTFRRMTVWPKARRRKPLRIKVVSVEPGDTVERLASRMAIGDRPVERFRVLNGLGPNDRVQAGRPGEDRGRVSRGARRIACLAFRRFRSSSSPLRASRSPADIRSLRGE